MHKPRDRRPNSDKSRTFRISTDKLSQDAEPPEAENIRPDCRTIKGPFIVLPGSTEASSVTEMPAAPQGD